MNVEQRIREILLGLPAVTTLVGAGAAARIRPDTLAQGDRLPAIIVEVDSEEHEHTLDGGMGWANTTLRIVCRAWTRRESRELARAVKGTVGTPGLDAYIGQYFDALVDSIQTHVTRTDDGSDRQWYDTDIAVTLIGQEAD